MKIQGLSDKLQKYFTSENPMRSYYSVNDVSEINMGWETNLFTFKVKYTENKIVYEKDFVLRAFTGGSAGDKASKEFYLMRKLFDVGYPVPKVHHIDCKSDNIGKPFVIMDRIIGETLDSTYRKESHEILLQGISRLVGLLVKLHQLNSSMFEDLPYLSTNDPIQGIIDHFQLICDDLAPWLSPLLAWIDENNPEEVYERKSILHLDYHGMNVMINENNEPYVIDWSAAQLGDYRLDLAWTFLLYTTFGGSIYSEPILENYRKLSGKKLEHFEFFEVIAATRRISDFIGIILGNKDSIGLKKQIVDIMRESKDHYVKVHDFLEQRIGFRISEFDSILETI